MAGPSPGAQPLNHGGLWRGPFETKPETPKCTLKKVFLHEAVPLIGSIGATWPSHELMPFLGYAFFLIIHVRGWSFWHKRPLAQALEIAPSSVDRGSTLSHIEEPVTVVTED